MKLVLLYLLASWALLFGTEVKVRVIDDQGLPLSDATVTISFVGYLQKNSKTHVSQSDQNGLARASGTAQDSIFVRVSRGGYYEARFEKLAKNKDHDQTVVLPRILNPRALFAIDTRIGRGLRGVVFPEQNVWLGYDFEVGDLIAPWGNGKIADIQFRFRNKFLGWKLGEAELQNARRIGRDVPEAEIQAIYGKWDAELEIGFPGEKEGIFEETRFLEYSQLKLPHPAPEDGYVPAWRYAANSYSYPTARENVGFFLRTRVKLDERGNIVSANYAKILGDFQLDASRGSVAFAYYFNPTPNDRNLEFDQKKNLFPASHPGANVHDP